MAFTVHDFQDMLVLLEQHPDWRRQLLVVLLPEDFLLLPASVDALTQAVTRLAERQERTEAAILSLAERQERTEAAILSLAEQQERTEAAVSSHTERLDPIEAAILALIERQERTEAAIQSLTERLDRYIAHAEAKFDGIHRDLGMLKGSHLESRYRETAAAVFGDRISGGRLASNEVGQWLHTAVKSGQLSAWERKQVLAADVLWSGKLWDSEQPVVLVVEASWTVYPDDVDRAFDRAALLQRIGRLAVPVAAGEVWADDVSALAASKRVAVLTEGMIDDESWDAALAEAAGRVAA